MPKNQPSSHPEADSPSFRLLQGSPASISRRRFLKIAGGATLGIAAYGTFFERTHLVIRREEFFLPRLPEAFDGFTIAQLSDLHYNRLTNAPVIRHAIQATNALKPDLIALTGDYVTIPWYLDEDIASAGDITPCVELVKQLSAPNGVVAVLGNHDHFSDPILITQVLAANSIQVLRNKLFPIDRSGARLWIAGIDCVLAGGAELQQTLRLVPPDATTVVLVHEPDFADQVARFPVDLQLSGHSHGGQVRIPYLGSPVLPRMARKYPLGRRKVHDLQLYTNPGIGSIHVPMRLFCPPEVTLVTLRTGLGGGSR